MYSGVCKYGGSLAGTRSKSGTSLEETLDTAGAEEFLVVPVPLDEEGRETMDVLLSAQLNPDGGGLAWFAEDQTNDNGDAPSLMNNVVAMSQMTSMLRDTDRNQFYAKMLTRAIEQFRAEFHRDPVVLDIGTGTGLLAMLAARAGAKDVYACELFPAMASIASVITRQNFPSGNIHVISKLSTDLEIGVDLPAKVDMVVSEVFDSALLGEGVIPTLRHAISELLAPASRGKTYTVLPPQARIFGQVIAYPELNRFHDIREIPDMARNTAALACQAGRQMFPMHADQCKNLEKLSRVFTAFEFDFTLPFPQASARQSSQRLDLFTTAEQKSVEANGVLVWWEMSFEDLKYSTASGVQNWQDHWVQGLYPLATRRKIPTKTKHENAVVHATHDDLSLTFHLKDSSASLCQVDVLPKHHSSESHHHPCQCGLHLLWNTDRFQMMADPVRTRVYAQAIASAIEKSKHNSQHLVECLDVSDGSFCALLAARHGSQCVTSVESKSLSALLARQIISGQGLDNHVEILESGVKGLEVGHLKGQKPVDVLMSEPFYYQLAKRPTWQALNFWYRRSALESVVHPETIFVPHAGKIVGMVIELPELSRCFGQVGTVEELDHIHLDNIQQRWAQQTLPLPMWMYNVTCLSKPVTLMHMPFSTKIHNVKTEVWMPLLAKKGTAHAVMYWMEYQMTRDAPMMTLGGPDQVYERQQIRFFDMPSSSLSGVQAHVQFEVQNGKIDLTFDPVP